MTGFFHPDKWHHHDENNETEKQKKLLPQKAARVFLKK